MENFLAMRRPSNTALFTDNPLITQRTVPPGFQPDGCTFETVLTDPDCAKGIYNLRPGSDTLEAGFIKDDTDMPQTKTKRPRNSLEKRLLVNARERERMRVLNNAFQLLRDALPCYIADGHMAKITTLRLAINYIKALTEVLNDDGSNSVARCGGHKSLSSGIQARPAVAAAVTSFVPAIAYPSPPVHRHARMFMEEELKGPKF